MTDNRFWSHRKTVMINLRLCLCFFSSFPADDPGSHFYHSHSGIFRGDGLSGSLVIRQSSHRDPLSDLYDLDLPDHVIVLTDWTHRPMIDLFASFYHGTDDQTPESILINGE